MKKIMEGEIAMNNEIGLKKSEQEHVKQLKRYLENWREVLLPLHSVLVWEKPFYPGILAGFVSLVFVLLWYFDLSILTTLSLFGILICLLDYGVPMISANVFDSNKWTGTQEHQFEDICKEIAHTHQQILGLYKSINDSKETKPKIFFAGILGALILTAWIGNKINNLLLTYLIALTIILLPGVRRHGILQQYLSEGLSMIKARVGQKQKKN